MSSNVSVIIQHINFTNISALHIICVNCTGHSSIIITDCNFTNINTVFYDYDDDYDYYDVDDDDEYDITSVNVYNNDNNFTRSYSAVYAYY